MDRKLLHFYATRQDLLPVLATVESDVPIKYVRMGLFRDATPEIHRSGSTLPRLGHTSSESSVTSDCYLVAPAGADIVIRKVPQLDGSIRYAIDQLENPGTLTIQPGGFWKPDVMLYGRIATVKEDATALKLYKLFASLIRKNFHKYGSDYVGPEAQGHWNNGVRLTLAEQSPREFDLTR